MKWLSKAGACPVLHGISHDRLIEVFGIVEYQVKRYKKDELLAIQGDEVKGLNILLTGSVRAEMTDFSGRMIKIEDISAPKPLAGAFVFGDDNYFPVDVLANEDVVVLIIYKDQFLKLLHYCPQAQINYLNLISKKTQFLTRKLKFLSFKTLKGKLAHYLLQQNQKNSGSIQIPISQQAMAELFGAARPSIARVFSQLEDEDILRIKNRQVTIMDQEKLIAYLD
ncbi:MAG: Crp/Fnr family transcriptional regulator [Bacteroidetes bacterium]|jgi:CRP/FNR family transcriptional regulator, dissimilatory nitrate respiration regulator|nr:Crp/Fnr family transcriptional regulator [Bacteroidota bacterium]MBT3749207.1 Crp/Fnr family transcriptional regulator [Bacteroidota bacterium]MBT4399784.1 Crp/Fnr family transcriptional regulator [Bacteroidota bacterium]MBT4410313.1 Crp/Fnr family transcriptional regulator [Bacteroidota bacterium]MBT5427997.1 Crp/Fnr family transcriptional regulator [Bacteroidota bacterium]